MTVVNKYCNRSVELDQMEQMEMEQSFFKVQATISQFSHNLGVRELRKKLFKSVINSVKEYMNINR